MPGSTGNAKYLFVNHWAARLGGAELSLIDILRCMVGRGSVHLLTTEDGPLTVAARDAGVYCHVIAPRHSLLGVKRGRLMNTVLSSWRGMVSFVGFVLRARALVRELRPDVVHANVPKSHVALLLMRAMGHQGPACFHMREIFDPGGLVPWIYQSLWRNRHARVISISRSVHEHLPQRLQAHSQVIHNGIEIPAAASELPAGSPVRFLYLGRVVPWKGCHFIIESFRILREHRREADLRLSIVGDTLYWDDSYREGLSATISRYDMDGCCELRSHTLDPYALMRASHVVCMASRLEPFGRVAAEAHACARPVVAFAGGGISEVVEEGVTGLLVPWGDATALASAMMHFVDVPGDCLRFGLAGYDRAKTLFNRDSQIPRICDSIEEMAMASSDQAR